MKVDCQKCNNVVELKSGKNWAVCILCGYMVTRPKCKWCNDGECPECDGEGDCPSCDGDENCGYCFGSGLCPECDGSGDCLDCDGTGYEQ